MMNIYIKFKFYIISKIYLKWSWLTHKLKDLNNSQGKLNKMLICMIIERIKILGTVFYSVLLCF